MASPLLQVLKHPAIRLFVIGTFLSSIGTWIQRITIGWLVFQQTESAVWVGGVAAAEVIPALLIAPIAGVLVDRGNRLKLFGIGQGLAMVQALALVGLSLAGFLEIPVLCGAAMLLGIIDGINHPTRLTLISDISPRDLIASAIGLNSVGFNVARFIGPVIAGVVLAGGGATLAFTLNAASFIPLIGLIGVLRHRQLPTAVPAALQMRTDFQAGILHIISHDALRPIFLLLLFYGALGRAYVELLPAIAGSLIGSAPEDLARLTATMGCGAMMGGLWMSHREDADAIVTATLKMPVGMVVMSGLFVGSIGQPGLYLHWGAYPCLFLAGFFQVACGVGMQSSIHLTVDPQYRGRVLALYSLIVRALPALGALGVGALAEFLGLRTAVLLGLVIVLIAWWAVWRARQRIYTAVAARQNFN